MQIRSSAILSRLNAWHVPTDNIAFEDTDTRRFRFAREMVQALRDDNIDLARTNLSTGAKDSTSNQQLRTAWSTDVGVLGSFQAVASQSKRVITGATLYVTRMTFSGDALELRLLFDNDDHIVNLWLATLGNSTPTQLEEAAKAFIQQMADQKSEQIYANVPESLKLYTSAQALQQTWMGWKGQAGEFVQIDAAQKVIDFDMVVVRCKFERAEILIPSAIFTFSAGHVLFRGACTARLVMNVLCWICIFSFGLVSTATLAQPGISDLNVQRANVILIHAARPNGTVFKSWSRLSSEF